MKKAVFIDRDGVVIEESDYAYRIEDLEFLPGSVEALRRLRETAFEIIIVTNQSGIARGYFTVEDYGRFTSHMLGALEREGVRIDGVYFCPHHPTEGVGEYRMECDCRKPGTGMLRKAAEEHGIELKGSWMIGDKNSDIRAGRDAGCRTILVRTGYGGSDSAPEAPPDHTADDLAAAVSILLDEEGKGR